VRKMGLGSFIALAITAGAGFCYYRNITIPQPILLLVGGCVILAVLLKLLSSLSRHGMKPYFRSFIWIVAVCLAVGYSGSVISYPLVLDVAALLSCLSWLFLIVKYPWNLYFKARGAYYLLLESFNKKDGYVKDSDLDDLRRLKQRSLISAILLHVISSAVLYCARLVDTAGELVNPSFVWLFAFSSLIRPLIELARYVQKLISDIHSRMLKASEDAAKERTSARYDNIQNEIPSAASSMKNILDNQASVREQRLNQFETFKLSIERFKTAKTTKWEAMNERIKKLAFRLQETSEALLEDADTLKMVRALVSTL